MSHDCILERQLAEARAENEKLRGLLKRLREELPVYSKSEIDAALAAQEKP